MTLNERRARLARDLRRANLQRRAIDAAALLGLAAWMRGPNLIVIAPSWASAHDTFRQFTTTDPRLALAFVAGYSLHLNS